MYVDLYFLLIIYVFSCVALGTSIYALWTFLEIKEYYQQRTKNVLKSKIVAKPPATKIPQNKGHWG